MSDVAETLYAGTHYKAVLLRDGTLVVTSRAYEVRRSPRWNAESVERLRRATKSEAHGLCKAMMLGRQAALERL